jgi:tetratricopeptide (TPR) repeat protein
MSAPRTALLGILLIGALFAVGCRRESPEDAAAQHPFLRRASEKAQERDIQGAIQLYRRALEEDSSLSRAHLQLGILYDETKDYIAAIYHYGQYLEQNPNLAADQRKWLEECIRFAKYNFVAEMPVNPGARKKIEELSLRVDELVGQNARLLAVARDLHRQLGAAAPAVPELQPAAAATPTAAPARPAAPSTRSTTPLPSAPPPLVESPPASGRPSTYRVVAGDTLSRVSAKVYGNANQWRRIQQANQLPEGAPLRVGQTLTIPP